MITGGPEQSFDTYHRYDRVATTMDGGEVLQVSSPDGLPIGLLDTSRRYADRVIPGQRGLDNLSERVFPEGIRVPTAMAIVAYEAATDPSLPDPLF